MVAERVCRVMDGQKLLRLPYSAAPHDVQPVSFGKALRLYPLIGAKSDWLIIPRPSLDLNAADRALALSSGWPGTANVKATTIVQTADMGRRPATFALI